LLRVEGDRSDALGFFGELALGDVLNRSFEKDRFAVPIVDQSAQGVNPASLAIAGADDLVFHVEFAITFDHALVVVEHLLLITRRHQLAPVFNTGDKRGINAKNLSQCD